MQNIKSYKLSSLLVFSIILVVICSASEGRPLLEPTAASASVPSTEGISMSMVEGLPVASLEVSTDITHTLYLPFINRIIGKFSGIYFDQYWTPWTVAEIMPLADQGAGKKHTSVGWFIDLEDTAFNGNIPPTMANNLYCQLESLWAAGYISFINLGTDANARQIMDGERDSEINYAAEVYKSWVSLGGGRRAMIAPLQEMNGVWTVYGRDSTSDELKQAFRYILNKFAQKGVTRDQVWWVFAPNGYSDPGDEERMFENYYPGDDVVDVVGFSSYNYGYCIEYPESYWRWESYPEIFEPYIDRMEVMAPTKPIIIAETASTAYYHDEYGNPVIDYDQMNQWLAENYEYFANHPSVVGIFYFSFEMYDGFNCEVEINPGGEVLSGYRDGLSDPVYRYIYGLDLDFLFQFYR